MRQSSVRLILCLTIVLVAWSSIAIAGLFGPRDYDECVLESMKGVTSDLAARAIMLSCRKKFPEKKQRDAELPTQALGNITGRAGFKYGIFTGHIYNGNSDYTVTQVTILLIPKGNEESAETSLSAKEYNVNVTVAPLTNGDFSVPVDSVGTAEFSWNITRARGYKTK